MSGATPLRILHLEDNSDDAILIQAMLESENVHCSIKNVQNRSDFIEALDDEAADLVIADYSLPSFDGISALKLARAKNPDLPFILMSGTVGEEIAVESLKSGATDYIMKDRAARLIPAVRRAMREVKDRAERKLLEEQFLQAQKMEVVGRLSGGVAHDFNNILAIIMGNNDLMLRKLSPGDPLFQHAEEIHHAADRAIALTRQLLVFSRNETLHPVVLDLNEVVESLGKMLGRLVDERIDLNIIANTAVGRIRADSGYLGQVLMNLVVNARDAMPTGGILTIETRSVTLNEAFAEEHPGVKAGDYVVLSVKDTGTGMTEEVKAHLFQAFFTTKPKGKGTGLGLTTCRDIVNQCGGHIDIQSELGKGTTVDVYFPQVNEPLDAPALSSGPEELPCGTETLLVVEDEAALRWMACYALEMQGYTVLQAASGEEGLRVVEDHRGSPIRLVITDVVMPQMGGKVMADLLTTAYPDLLFLFTSGYSEDAPSPEEALDPHVTFLPKPYSLAGLARKVREVLDSRSGD